MAQTTMTSGNLQSLLRLMDDKGMTDLQFTKILSSGILADVFDPNADLGNREAVRIALRLDTGVPDVFHLTVDYRQSFEQMVAAGHYDWFNTNITAERFPIVGEGVVEFEARYFRLNRNISSDDAVKEIESADTGNPWMPAKIEHTLSHGKTFPEEQRKFPIVGLGSVAEVSGSRHVPYLYEGGSKRGLYLDWWNDVWDPAYRFLAVRKVSGT